MLIVDIEYGGAKMVNDSEPPGKILFVSDVHGLVSQLINLISFLLYEQKERIDCVVSLGDFWKGRNFNGQEIVRDHWNDCDVFSSFPINIFHIKGNEDQDIPDNFWMVTRNVWLMPDEKPFKINGLTLFPVHFTVHDEKQDVVRDVHQYKNCIDILVSHNPAFGILDNTLHYKTHEVIKTTGSMKIRKYLDEFNPALHLFGHFHYSNFIKYNKTLVVCLDKMFRVNKMMQKKYSYALVDPVENTLDVIWRNRNYLKYNLLEREIKFVDDKRNNLNMVESEYF